MMETFAKKLIDLRKQQGLTQEQLALDLNISQSSVSNYESGATKPDTAILNKIAEYFHVPITYFFNDEKMTFNTQTNNGVSVGYFSNSTFNAMSEKLIELYELRIKELQTENDFLRSKIK